MQNSRYTIAILLVDLLLWIAFVVMHQNEQWLHTRIPMYVHLPLWSGLLGAAIGGLSGRLAFMLGGAIVGGVVLPLVILALFALAFSGG